MKKLMIVAAVAAIVGGAFAADDGYDFSATLKTTQGRAGASPRTVSLGANAAGTAFWYTDPSVTNFLDSTKNLGGKTVPTISAAKMKNNAAAQAAVKALESTFGYKHAGQWCATWTFQEQGCYRVAGSVRIDIPLFVSNCCAISTGAISLTNAVGGVAYNLDLSMVQRFGAKAYSKATKVEVYSTTMYLPIKDSVKDVGRKLLTGALAGQGTFSNGRVTSVNGNIVGILDAPKCVYCCSLPDAAVAFYCDDPTEYTGLQTAGYGTFRLKYNSRLQH